MNKHTKRRKRRQQKAAIKNYRNKPRHKLRAGRTGSVHKKKLQAMLHETLRHVAR